MKLVINIPEDMYNDANILIVKDLLELKKVIANGTPLPKGHGRLIDADALEINAPTLYDDFYCYPCLAVVQTKVFTVLTVIKRYIELNMLIRK